MRRQIRMVVMGGALLATSIVGWMALAQNATPGPTVRVRGTIEKLQGDLLTVKSRDGRTLNLSLAPNLSVAGVAKRSLADIKAGDYIASTSVKRADGKLHALEVHIFPEAMRGVSEGQFPTDLVPESLMTNATVAGISAAPEGQVLKVTFKGQQAEVVVDPTTPIVTYTSGDASLLKPGAAIVTGAQQKPDGTLVTARIVAEKDGVKPPM